MGLILDSSVLIAAERRGESLKQLVGRLRLLLNDAESAISAITVIELTHGIYRARTDVDRLRRRTFTEDIFHGLVVHPVSLEIAQLAGRIEGEQAAIGISIAIEDLIIGATALHLGFDVVTLNEKHFRLIPGLKTVPLQLGAREAKNATELGYSSQNTEGDRTAHRLASSTISTKINTGASTSPA